MTRILPVKALHGHLWVEVPNSATTAQNNLRLLPTRLPYKQERKAAFEASRSVTPSDEHNKFITDVLCDDDYGGRPLTYKTFNDYITALELALPVPTKVEVEMEIVVGKGLPTCQFCSIGYPISSHVSHHPYEHIVYHIIGGSGTDLAACTGILVIKISQGNVVVKNWIY